MNRRQFAKRGALTAVVFGISATAFKCGSEKVSIYVSTIVSFLREISGLVPAQAAFISKIIDVAGDFDDAYRRGDFANASAFFNTLVANITQLTDDLGVNVSSQVKMWLAVVSATVRTIALLLKQQGESAKAAVSDAKANRAQAESISLIEKLSSEKSVNATLEAVRLHR